MRFFQQADIDEFAAKYEPAKCSDVFTVRGHIDDSRKFYPFETDIYTLLTEIFCRNPHLMDMVAERLAGSKLDDCNERWYTEGKLAYEHTLKTLLSEAHMKE